jgi:hypothetical protein
MNYVHEMNGETERAHMTVKAVASRTLHTALRYGIFDSSSAVMFDGPLPITDNTSARRRRSTSGC